MRTCTWTLDDYDPWQGDSWDTGCGNKFEFTVGGPVENTFSFCPYCGSVLRLLPPTSPEDG